jgi:hypothetical protein
MNCGFYGFASCSVILREEDKLRVFEIGYWVMYKGIRGTRQWGLEKTV